MGAAGAGGGHLRCSCCRARLGEWQERDGERVLRLDLARIRAAEYHRAGLMVRCRACGAGNVVTAGRPAA